jgi:hypothetical protein
MKWNMIFRFFSETQKSRLQDKGGFSETAAQTEVSAAGLENQPYPLRDRPASRR